MTPAEALRRATSRHEAGHAAAAVLLGLDVHAVAVGDLDVHADPNTRVVGLTAVPVDVRDADELRRRAIATLVPLVDEPGGAPPWPLPDAPPGGDVAQLGLIITALDLDADGYRRLTTDALDLSLRRDYRALRDRLASLAERHGYLDAEAVKTATTEGTHMEHLNVKATTVATDQGAFTAVISSQSVDREKDIVSAAGMVRALRQWNRPIPLAWDHSRTAADIFGHVDPQSVHERNGEVIVAGQVHMDSAVGREAWRSFKSRAVGFSFGYLALASTRREGGGRLITALDVYEVSATPTPMNNDTRVLAAKSLTAERDDLDDIIRRAFELAEHDGDLRRKAAEHAAYAATFAPIRVRTFDA